MRLRVGNPSGEAHGQAMRVYDWIAPVGTDPHDALVKAEAALGLKLGAVATADVHGYMLTSLRPDGSLYVAVHLYDTGCTASACPAGHGAVTFSIAPNVASKTAAMMTVVGEHAAHKLGTGDDAATLKALGFATATEKLLARGAPAVVVVDAETAKCAECGTVAVTDGPLR